MIKKLLLTLVFTLIGQPLLCENSTLLHEIADTFSARLIMKKPVRYEEVIQDLSFIEEGDGPNSFIITKYGNKDTFAISSGYDNETEKPLNDFYSLCFRVYQAHTDIDPTAALAIQILYNCVVEKYQVHLNLLDENRRILESAKIMSYGRPTSVLDILIRSSAVTPPISSET
jgi:hypothetical protein